MRKVGALALKNPELCGGIVKDGVLLYAKLPYNDDVTERVDLARNSLEAGCLSFVFEINERKPPIHDVPSFLAALGLCYLEKSDNVDPKYEALDIFLSINPELTEYDLKDGDDLAGILANRFNIRDVRKVSVGKIIERKIKTRNYGFVPAYAIIAEKG